MIFVRLLICSCICVCNSRKGKRHIPYLFSYYNIQHMNIKVSQIECARSHLKTVRRLHSLSDDESQYTLHTQKKLKALTELNYRYKIQPLCRYAITKLKMEDPNSDSVKFVINNHVVPRACKLNAETESTLSKQRAIP